ncbi:hypothetical protein MYFR107205_10995 [Mycolicibacterium frederiksbergense]
MATFALVVGVALVAAIGGYLVGRPSPRRSRRVFIAGFLCGSVAGSVLRGRRRRLAHQAMRRVLPQLLGGAVAAGPRRSASLFDEVRRHRPYNGNSRNDSHAHRRARNRRTVRT